MQHQYWVTKKSVLRKLGGKEDECIISSDAELDAKLELFKSINDSCNHLQRILDSYQERLCYLAQEENTLGRYLKDCGKNEKNSSAGQIMACAGKALAYMGHQRLTERPPLVRLHHEVETFRARAVTDTRATVSEMEKIRTEYRAALSWMKSASAQLDPDTGHGLEKFRKAQSYVKSTKVKFDRLTLACLQKIDLLAAARCNMFSHALVPYQNALINFSTKAAETLDLAAGKIGSIQPSDGSSIFELAAGSEGDKSGDKDKNTFFNAEYADEKKDEAKYKENPEHSSESEQTEVANLLQGDFAAPTEQQLEAADLSKPSSALLDLNWSVQSDFMKGNFMPSKLMQEEGFMFMETPLEKEASQKSEKSPDVKRDKSDKQMSWLSLFAELDPLSSKAGQSGDTA
ncbi:unnamed protein product [Acanthoscelides obtectus]|uniref:AH domain-containing protein n=1 Tax=Acanthoscelides obtectus TaxID=200917 RepID=A0A9P0LFL2_ACAOB|nr:unnamed protein product [Acanthoscelides obtectus]CAK1669795.1 Islet cell autoantigen 1 [Acanthoscelides obtectus]